MAVTRVNAVGTTACILVGVAMMVVAATRTMTQQRSVCAHAYTVRVGNTTLNTRSDPQIGGGCWSTALTTSISGAFDDASAAIIDWSWVGSSVPRMEWRFHQTAWPLWLLSMGYGMTVASTCLAVRRKLVLTSALVVIMVGSLCIYAGTLATNSARDTLCAVEYSLYDETNTQMFRRETPYTSCTEQRLTVPLDGTFPAESPARVFATWSVRRLSAWSRLTMAGMGVTAAGIVNLIVAFVVVVVSSKSTDSASPV